MPAVRSTGDGIRADAGMWTFAGKAALDFDTHVSRSILLYHEGHNLISKLSEFYIGPGSVCYEIGCSTATLLSSLSMLHANKPATFIGIDIERDMIDVASRKCAGVPNLTLCHGNALEFTFAKADFVVAYYTLQFMKVGDRAKLIAKIFRRLNRGCALVVFEKTRSSDARFQDINTQLYVEYKIDRGYTADEILSKTRSLRRTLEPLTAAENMDMLRWAGFRHISSIMKFMCFEGFLAIK